MRRLTTFLAAVLVIGVIAHGSWAIPSRDCLLIERRARIAQMKGEQDLRFSLLEEAAEKCGNQVQTLMYLQREYRRAEGYEEKLAEVHGRLVELLKNGAQTVPLPLVNRLLNDPLTTEEELEIAEIAARRAVELQPDSLKALESLANVLARKGEHADSRDVIDQLIEREDKPIYRENGFGLDLTLGRWDSALAHIRTLMANGDNRPSTQIHFVSLLARAGRHEELIKHSKDILGTEKRFALPLPLMIDAAWSLYDAGYDKEAEEYFRLLQSAYPRVSELQETVLHLFATGEEKAQREAESEARWARERSPTALLREGSARLAAGDVESAVNMIERVTQAAPNLPVGWYNLGLASIKLERWEKAESAFARALTLDGTLFDAYYNRGIALVQLKRFDEALADLERYIEKNPEQKAPWYYVYICHKSMGNMDQAGEALKRYQ